MEIPNGDLKRSVVFVDKFLQNELLARAMNEEAVKVFLCDERKVSYNDSESTYGAYQVRRSNVLSFTRWASLYLENVARIQTTVLFCAH